MIEALAEQAFAPAAKAVADGRLPGATLGVVTRDGARAVRLAGHAALLPSPERLTREHWFDLASLTKVIATTPMILSLAARGLLDLDAPLTSAIPDLRQYDIDNAPERRLTFRDCLAHRTHLPAVEPIYTYGDDPARLRAFVLQRKWRAGPPVYSDINFILLGIAIERLTGARLDAWPHAAGLSYHPPGPTVATEACPWRGRLLNGEVHDENASALGGAAGHAGLFGTVDGVLDFAAATLADSPPDIRQPLANHRTCGWELRHPGWSGGDACAPGTIGHTGFTGTGLWIDFTRGLAWTLLSNRIHPTRHRESGIFEIRPATGDAVIAAFDARTPAPAPSSRRKPGSP